MSINENMEIGPDEGMIKISSGLPMVRLIKPYWRPPSLSALTLHEI